MAVQYGDHLDQDTVALPFSLFLSSADRLLVDRSSYKVLRCPVYGKCRERPKLLATGLGAAPG